MAVEVRASRGARVERRALRHEVLQAIQEAIWSGDLRPGEPLVETELAERIGVSRGPVREAIRELEKQGLVVNVPNRGSFVTQWTVQDVAEVYGVRRVLEGLAARTGARRLTPEGLEQLEEIVGQMRLAAQAGELLRLVDLEMAFHQALAHSSGNRRLVQMLADIYPQVKMFIAAAEVRYRMFDNLDAIAETHVPVLEALRAGDPDAAERCAEGHVHQACERLVERMLRDALA